MQRCSDCRRRFECAIGESHFVKLPEVMGSLVPNACRVVYHAVSLPYTVYTEYLLLVPPVSCSLSKSEDSPLAVNRCSRTVHRH